MKITKIRANPKRYTDEDHAKYKNQLKAMSEDAQFQSMMAEEMRRRGWPLVAERLEDKKGISLNLGRFPLEETTKRNEILAEKLRRVGKLKERGWTDESARKEVFGDDAFAKSRIRGGNKEASDALRKMLEAEQEENAIPSER